MDVIYAHEHPVELPAESIFLAGPSPRSNEEHNWRPHALAYLNDLAFNGTVYVPLPKDGIWTNEYDSQVEWELKYLEECNVISFWIPRDKNDLPGFTTNVEFGMFAKSKKCVLGYPIGADKMKYLHHVAMKFGIPVHHTLLETLQTSVNFFK